jgi:hypothetical protein
MTSSWIQAKTAMLLQDLKRTRATADVFAAIASSFFGGKPDTFALRRVHLTQYHVRQTSRRVIRHGVQVSLARDFRPWSYGSRENVRRYGTSVPPSYSYVCLRMQQRVAVRHNGDPRRFDCVMCVRAVHRLTSSTCP